MGFPCVAKFLFFVAFSVGVASQKVRRAVSLFVLEWNKLPPSAAAAEALEPPLGGGRRGEGEVHGEQLAAAVSTSALALEQKLFTFNQCTASTAQTTTTPAR